MNVESRVDWVSPLVNLFFFNSKTVSVHVFRIGNWLISGLVTKKINWLIGTDAVNFGVIFFAWGN